MVEQAMGYLQQLGQMGLQDQSAMGQHQENMLRQAQMAHSQAMQPGELAMQQAQMSHLNSETRAQDQNTEHMAGLLPIQQAKERDMGMQEQGKGILSMVAALNNSRGLSPVGRKVMQSMVAHMPGVDPHVFDPQSQDDIISGLPTNLQEIFKKANAATSQPTEPVVDANRDMGHQVGAQFQNLFGHAAGVNDPSKMANTQPQLATDNPVSSGALTILHKLLGPLINASPQMWIDPSKLPANAPMQPSPF